MKKILMILLVLAVVGGTAFAFDAKSHPEPMQKGSFMISPTFGIGTYYYAGATLAFTAAFDYALPINFGLTVGGEVGFAMTTYSGWGYGYTYKPFAIPIMAKVAWHPNFEVKGLDPYVTLKMGFAIGILGCTKKYGSYEAKAASGFAMGWDVGCRYFFNNSIGVFGELGFDRYWVGIKERTSYAGYDSGWVKWRWPMTTFFRAGVTFMI